MLKKETQFWESLLFLADCVILAGCWLFAYYLRFQVGWPVPVYYGVPELSDYLVSLLFLPPVWGVLFKALGLFSPRRRQSRSRELLDLVKASSLLTLGLFGAGYMLFKLEISRVFLATFWLSGTVGLVLARVAFREAVRFARRRGYYVRNALVLGTDDLGRYIHRRLRLHPELGFRLRGYLTTRLEEVGAEIEGVPVLGHMNELRDVLQRERADQLFVSLSPAVQMRLEGLLGELDDGFVNISLVSDLFQHAFLRGHVEEFEGLPIIAISEPPLLGWSRVLKRSFDLVVAGALLVLCAPLLGLIALLVKLSSPGPIFYRQERMGLDGRTFDLVKFRTMRADAEESTGAVWSQRGDPRCTPIGAFLRRSSLDELPQLWNVLKGEMSLVGPRPERPVFVDEFRSRIPRYMLRHRVKSGITGWAQVHGLRGATSVTERLRYDLFYIENWSLSLDLKILWRTLCGGFLNRSA